MTGSIGDQAQIRALVEQVAEGTAEIAISKFCAQHPEVRQSAVVAEIPAPLKWAAIIASTIITVSASAGLVWLVSTVSEMSITLARIDERQTRYVEAQTARMEDIERRLDRYNERIETIERRFPG